MELVETKPVKLEGDLSLSNIEMRYQEHLDPALRDLSFDIKAGEKVAVVGRTGAGKSSLFQVLQGFREPCAG